MKAAIIQFPASNCDRDAAMAIKTVTGQEADIIWHRETSLPKNINFVIIPGGFSYGDYLRCGAMAARSPIVKDIVARAKTGLTVAGFCNGFQILTEAGLLPGALIRNKNLKFLCRPEVLRVENTKTRFTSRYKPHAEVTYPIAHHDGNYFADEPTLKKIEKNGQVLFRYANNPNGSVNDIAGLVNEAGNVFGMMPHPERAIDPLHGGTDGVEFFKSIIESIK